jgi:hypothetical protein
LGAAVYFVGGMDFVKTLIPKVWPSGQQGNTAPVAPSGTAATATSTPQPASGQLILPPGVSEDLAKRMYVEQIQSQTNLKKMAAGEISSLRVTSVRTDKKKSRAEILVAARFSDGSSAPGVIQLVKPDATWFFMSITGLSTTQVSGSATTVQKGSIAEGEQDNAKVIADSGVTDFDYGVINTFLGQQMANQSIIVSIVDGVLTDIVLGVPKDGAGTTSVPSALTGKNAAAADGDAVLIDKTVAQEDLTFLAMFRAK